MGKKNKNKLRQGFTTGTAAAAAAKAALWYLLASEKVGSVKVGLLNGTSMDILVASVRPKDDGAAAIVIKDAGDDPDVTNKARIGAIVRLISTPGDVVITGGSGVGIVTKPGLEIPPGEPAINPGPRQMIRQSVKETLTAFNRTDGVSVEVFVVNGEILAKKTLNHRLGIVGGLSILGTTGIVKPLSHEAYIATIASAMSVAKACGGNHVVLTTGRRSERFAQTFYSELPDESFIQIGDFFKMSMECAATHRFQHVSLAVFFGKALKMAQGIPHTHASKSRLTMEWLAGHVRGLTGDDSLANQITQANTARQAFGIVYPLHANVLEHIGKSMIQSAKTFCNSACRIRAIIFDFDGNVAFDSRKGRPDHE